MNLKLRDSKATLKPGRLAPIKNPKILHRIQSPQLEKIRDMNAGKKDISQSNSAGVVKDEDSQSKVMTQEEKRIDSDMVKIKNRNEDFDSSSASVEVEAKPKPKPEPEIKFPLDVSGGYAPEPYQYLTTFDAKELANQYNVRIIHNVCHHSSITHP